MESAPGSRHGHRRAATRGSQRGEALNRPQSQTRVASFLERMRENPPNVLLLEGGTREEREELSLYWAALLNCRDNPPCGQCPACRAISQQGHRDLYILRGGEESIGVEDVRPLRGAMGDAPQEDFRVMVLSEAQDLTVSAANALLKSLEEPLPGNTFVLLCPQKDLLLPTLVSRSFSFTLGWSPAEADQRDQDVSPWLESLRLFWQSGQGLFQHTGKKKAVDRELLLRILRALQLELSRVFLGTGDEPLAGYLRTNLPWVYWSRMDLALKKAEEILKQPVNPALVLEWLALLVWGWLREDGGGADSA